jgi:hypothetical protein
MKTKRIPVPENWKDLKPHPLAELAPFGMGISARDLGSGMREFGYDQGEPVILIERDGVLEVLDGRHRLAGAQEADIVPSFAVYLGDNPLAYVAKKLLRQHLNESQRSMMAAALMKAAIDSKGAMVAPSQKEAAESADVSVRTMKDAVRVAAEGGEKLKLQVISGRTPVNVAADITRSVFCPRCRSCGPRRNCAECQELRAEAALAARKKTSKPKKIGSEKFDWKAFDHHYGFIARGIDGLKRAYGDADEHGECVALMRQFRMVFEGWKKRVTGVKD